MVAAGLCRSRGNTVGDDSRGLYRAVYGQVCDGDFRDIIHIFIPDLIRFYNLSANCFFGQEFGEMKMNFNRQHGWDG